MNYRHGAWLRQLRSLSGALALSAVVITGAACSSDDGEIEAGRNNVTSEDISGEISVDGVSGIDSPDELIGQLVTVRNPVVENIDGNNFVIGSDGEEGILIINTTGELLSPPSEEVPIQVTGEVTRFSLADTNAQYNLSLDEALYADYEGQPTIIAESIALAPKIDQLVEYSEAFTGQLIALKGDVRQVTSPDTMTLFEEGWVDDIGIIVTGVESNLKTSEPLQEGETYVVTGRAQPFDADTLSQKYDLGLEPDQLEEFSQRYNRPVIIADDVYSSAVDG